MVCIPQKITIQRESRNKKHPLPHNQHFLYYSIEDVFVGRISPDEQMEILRSMYDHRHKNIGYDGWGPQGEYYDNIMYRSFKSYGMRARQHPVKLKVDSYIPFIQKLFIEKKILFSNKVLQNNLFREQFFNFSSKKDNDYDDAVDALFCAVHLLIELEYFTNR